MKYRLPFRTEHYSHAEYIRLVPNNRYNNSDDDDVTILHIIIISLISYRNFNFIVYQKTIFDWHAEVSFVFVGCVVNA